MSTNLQPSPAEGTAIVTMGFGNLASFEFMQRTANMFSQSSMVPTAYRAVIQKGYGNNVTTEQNPAAIPNCMVALNMSQRMNADPLMIMQNLNVIEGRPSWSSQYIIAAINSCGRYSPLRFEFTEGEEIDATYTTYEWENNKKKAVTTKVRVRNMTCIAWANELATNTRLESPKVTMEMAVNEGWYGKNGSKWQTMPDLMLRYRSAAFFGRLYAPELLMGLPGADEVRDTIELTTDDDGNYSVPEGTVPSKATVKEPVSKSAKAAAKAEQVSDVAPKAGPAPEQAKAEPQIASAPTGEAAAPAPEPTAASAADPKTGELPAIVNAGQVKYLEQKIKALELPDTAVSAMLQRIGAKSLKDLNLEQFDQVRTELLGMGA
jgi:hypothetical protein